MLIWSWNFWRKPQEHVPAASHQVHLGREPACSYVSQHAPCSPSSWGCQVIRQPPPHIITPPAARPYRCRGCRKRRRACRCGARRPPLALPFPHRARSSRAIAVQTQDGTQTRKARILPFRGLERLARALPVAWAAVTRLAILSSDDTAPVSQPLKMPAEASFRLCQPCPTSLHSMPATAVEEEARVLPEVHEVLVEDLHRSRSTHEHLPTPNSRRRSTSRIYWQTHPKATYKHIKTNCKT